MTGGWSLSNRQRARPVKLRALRSILNRLTEELCGSAPFELSVCLISSAEMARLNETFLRHAGPTDVLSFDYSERGDETLRGEVFVCVEVAVAQAHRFRTSWQSELVRYAVHGLLHLKGHDDHLPAGRRRMKREEGRLLRKVKEEMTDL